MATMSLEQRLCAPGSKRVLSLDGGGIRALITLRYLDRIEAVLRDRQGQPDLVLADYFDLIGGTSTGSIVATCLSLGWEVERIREMYLDLGRQVFRVRRHWLGPLGRILGPRFDESPLEEVLREHFGDRTLDSPDLKTGLVIVAKRVDTGSVWVMTNVPGHPFYEMNRRLPVWRVVRASTAAPPFFRPTYFEDIGQGEPGVFVDGGISMHLNPALQMFMVATLEGFGLRWATGSDELLLCSVGTGAYMNIVPERAARQANNFQLLGMLVSQVIRDASELNQTILQWISDSPTAVEIDGQIGSLAGDLLGTEPLLTYLRYNIDLDRDSLDSIDLQFDDHRLRRIRQMSNVDNMDDLETIGERAAQHQVNASHFPTVLDTGSAAGG